MKTINPYRSMNRDEMIECLGFSCGGKEKAEIMSKAYLEMEMYRINNDKYYFQLAKEKYGTLVNSVFWNLSCIPEDIDELLFNINKKAISEYKTKRIGFLKSIGKKIRTKIAIPRTSTFKRIRSLNIPYSCPVDFSFEYGLLGCFIAVCLFLSLIMFFK